ncbi:MAG: dihydrolipoyl dehydrogenase [Robiginitomaculum sp.]|nr:MAG: dihydrolipoyl dehydrogenase [Robiginitomaculum sp.]
MTNTNFDLIILGSGPGGYVAAIRAAQLGLKTVVIEREHIGGVCLNWGCIPTKALLRSAEVFEMMQHAEQFGISCVEPKFDLQKIVKRSRDVAGQLSQGVKFLLKKNKVEVIDGEGRLTKGKGAPLVVVKDKKGKESSYQAKNVILATGARARTIPALGLEPDGKFIWTAKEAMVPDTMPKSLLVIGSGAIGIEFASFYQAFGCKVTVVEMLDRILPVEDTDISSFAHKSFTAQGMDIRTDTQVKKVTKTGKGVIAELETKGGKSEKIEIERIILAIGIEANTDGIGLNELGVKLDRGHVTVDDFSKTNIAGLYAIGDITAPPWLAHKASHEGIICVEKIAEKSPHPLDHANIPGCTYCRPQIASVGMTEAAAKAAGYKTRIGRFPFIGNGKAIAMGDADGLIKTIFDAKTGELLGAHLVGSEVTELIQGFVIGRVLETTEAELMETVFAHPTLSEMMHESVLNAYDRGLHM